MPQQNSSKRKLKKASRSAAAREEQFANKQICVLLKDYAE
jgi:hypothetical protein